MPEFKVEMRLTPSQPYSYTNWINGGKATVRIEAEGPEEAIDRAEMLFAGSAWEFVSVSREGA